jgi:hypothetical protein
VFFFSQDQLIVYGVSSSKTKGYKYSRALLKVVESKVSFPECPAVRQTGLIPNQPYDLLELEGVNRNLQFNYIDDSNSIKDIVLYETYRGNEVLRSLNYTSGGLELDEYFGKNFSGIGKSNFLLGFSAHGAGEDIGLNYVNFRNAKLNPIQGEFSRPSTATYIDKNGQMKVAAENMPRIDWGNGEPELLIERESTNLLENTENLIYWGGTNQEPSESDEFIFGHKATQYTMNDTNGDKTSHISYYRVSGMEVGKTYTCSIYAKAGSLKHLTLQVGVPLSNFSPIGSVRFTLEGEGEVSHPDRSTIKHVGSGWYHCILTTTCIEHTSTTVFSVVPNINTGVQFVSDGTETIHVAMPQVEEGLVASSYIPTNGSPVTRAAESLSVEGLDDVLNPEEGMLYVEGGFYDTGSVNNVVSLHDGTPSNRLHLQRTQSQKSGFVHLGNGKVNMNTANCTPDFTNTTKIALNYTKSKAVGVVKAGCSESSLITSPMVRLNTLSFKSYNNSVHFHGRIKNVVYSNKALEEGQLHRLVK